MVNLSGRIAAAYAAASPTATSSAPATGAPTPGACALITLTGLRSHGAIMNATNTPTTLHKYQVASDPKSFTARVSAAEVTSAGIDTSGMSQSSSVVVVVNHGHFPPEPVRGRRRPRREFLGPAAAGEVRGLAHYLVDPNTDKVISFVLGDNNCIRE